MPQGPDGKTIIIVKKVSGHGGHHGGAWKVAYADFVTAMMALFLVLWLVNTASVVTRERIANYFKRPGIFEKGSGTPLGMDGNGILPDTFAPPSEGNSQTQPSPNNRIYQVDTGGGPIPEAGGGVEGKGPGKGEEAKKNKEKQKKNFEAVATQIQEAVQVNQKAVTGAIGQVQVLVDQRGLHLEIMDTPTASMFKVGKAEILPEAEEELGKISQILINLPNPVDVEGHTDAVPFRATTSGHYDNWNLSADRANAARRILVQAGLKEEQIARVVGYAAQRPKIKENPEDPANRRISISMRFTDQAATALVGTNVIETAPTPTGRTAVEKPAEPVTDTEKKDENSAVAVKNQDGVETEEGENSEDTNQPDLDKGVTRDTASGLSLEVNTTQPEGTPLTAGQGQTITKSQTPSLPNNQPLWMEKDKIFGHKNPFDGQ